MKTNEKNPGKSLTLLRVNEMRRSSLMIILAVIIFLSSCNYKVYYRVDKNKIYSGDSVRVEWKISNPYKIKSVSLGDVVQNKPPFEGSVYVKPESDTTFCLNVVEKTNAKNVRKIKRAIKILDPKIAEFSAFRDRFDSSKVTVTWNVKDFMKSSKDTSNRIFIEGYYYNLSPSGTITINNSYSAATFNLVVATPFNTFTKSCFVEGFKSNQRPMIVNDTAIYAIPGSHRIFMKIIETKINKYPDEITLKVLVYDSLGNFITHLAPPYATEDICRKYFRRIVDKAKDVSIEPKFEVKEINKSPDAYDLALVLDYSGSMSPYMDFYEKATKKFIENKFPGDYYSVTKFDHRMAPASPLTKDYKDILKKTGLGGKDTLGGSTALYAGIDCGLSSLANSSNKRLVLAFTDGYENSSFSYFGTYSWDINDMITNIRKENASLMLMGLGLTNTVLLNEMAYYSNGEFYYLANPAAITDVYRDMQHNMRTYYEITFKPLASETEHEVQLTYFNNKDTTVTTRPVYTGNNIAADHDMNRYQVDTTVYWYDKELAKKGYKFAFTPQTLAYFETNEEKLIEKYYPQMQKLVNYLNKYPKSFIRIYGHTDTRGEDGVNTTLSQKRAESLRNFLLSKGISSTRIKYFGFGSKYLINKNDKEEWAARENRRVEVVLWKK